MPTDPVRLARLAEEHLTRARGAIDRGSWTEAVVWTHLAAEVAVTALSISAGEDTRKQHLRRASLARRLYEAGVVDEDLGSLLIRLNTERKRAVHEGVEPDLRGRSWDDVITSVGGLVDAAARRSARA